MKKILLSSLLFLLVMQARAQGAEDSVKAVINKFFTSMRAADKNAVLECFTGTAVLQTVARTRSGADTVRSEDMRAFAESISKLPKDSADERIVFDMIKIDGALASAWTPYKFYYGGKLRHCGVNSFQLVRLDGNWRIQYIIDTRRRYGCQ